MLPRILLIGDSIRMGYTPIVREQLIDEADIVEIPQNGGDSHNVVTHLVDWLEQARGSGLAIVHFNCGLHDIKRPFDAAENQQPLAAYVSNLKQIVQLLNNESHTQLIWATTTPVISKRHHETKGFDRFEDDVDHYNAEALAIMQACDVAVNDLYQVIQNDSVADCIGRDGVHMTERGNQLLADAVAQKLRVFLTQPAR